LVFKDKEDAVALDNSVEADKNDFNNFTRLRSETISTGLGEKDKFVERSFMQS